MYIILNRTILFFSLRLKKQWCLSSQPSLSSERMWGQYPENRKVRLLLPCERVISLCKYICTYIHMRYSCIYLHYHSHRNPEVVWQAEGWCFAKPRGAFRGWNFAAHHQTRRPRNFDEGTGGKTEGILYQLSVIISRGFIVMAGSVCS